MKQSNRFNEIKKKHALWAIAKSAVCGISLGLFVTGVLLLALKLSAITFAIYYYVIIGVGVAAVCGAALYLLRFRPTDKQVAKRTDEDFGLDERVQTALEYRNEGGTIVELQRADAEEKILNLPPRRFSFARVWKFAVIILLGLAIAAVGIAVPAKAADDKFVDPDSTPRQVTELERAGVRELIANIEDSSLGDWLKTPVVGVLEQLMTDLDTANTEGTLKHAVDTAINMSGSILSSTLSYVPLGDALSANDEAYLGQAVSNSGRVYRYYLLTVYDEVRTFDATRFDAVNVKVGKSVTSLRNVLTATIAGGLAQLLEKSSSGINAALASVNVAESDGLYILLKSFAAGLAEIKSSIGGGADNTEAQNVISDLISKFIVNATNEISTQTYNAAIKVFISNRLKKIFGYPSLELPIEDPDKGDGTTDGPGTDDKKPPDDENHQGSGGSGQTQFGSDDEVWVPGRGYMKYGDVIREYYSLINQYLHSDELTEEQKNMVRAYYDILFGSNKNK